MIHIKLFFIYFTIKIVFFCSIPFCCSFLHTNNSGGFNTQREQFCDGLSPNELHTHRYHQETRRCYRVGDKGPCGPNMKFFAGEDNSGFGQCDCDYFNLMERLLIYHEPTQQCYFVMTQGYCRAGHHLIFNAFEPTCVWNPCQFVQQRWNYNSNKPTEIVLFKNSCVRLDEPSRFCNANEVVTFVLTSPFPQCGKRKMPSPVGHGHGLEYRVPTLRCVAGSRQSTIAGKCWGRVKFGVVPELLCSDGSYRSPVSGNCWPTQRVNLTG